MKLEELRNWKRPRLNRKKKSYTEKSKKENTKKRRLLNKGNKPKRRRKLKMPPPLLTLQPLQLKLKLNNLALSLPEPKTHS